jgi:hypothetical protein
VAALSVQVQITASTRRTGRRTVIASTTRMHATPAASPHRLARLELGGGEAAGLQTDRTPGARRLPSLICSICIYSLID